MRVSLALPLAAIAAFCAVTTANAGYSRDGTAHSGATIDVVGLTAARATDAAGGRPGVLGRDTSHDQTHTFDLGVQGLSTYGTGVQGGSQGGYGVEGYGSVGVFGQGAQHGGGTGVRGDTIHGIGVLATTTDGIALVAQATQGSALELRAPATNAYGPTYLLFGDDGNADRRDAVTTVSIDAAGNEYLAGALTTKGATTTQTYSRTGASVASYGARSASPTLEDFGQGTLANGVAHVALDRVFASTIDTRTYLVFVTPHGESRGLYTTVPTATGFDVRENAPGRATLAFDYRVVGRPLDTAASHLPAISTLASVARAKRAPHTDATRP